MSNSSVNNKLVFKPGALTDPSQLAGREVPAQEWFVDGLIPHKTVTLLSGDGGLGKSLLMQQLATCAALGIPWLGFEVRKCKTFALFCEDSNEELWRRQTKICESNFTPLEAMYNFNWISGDGIDPVLMSFESGAKGEQTEFFKDLVEQLKLFEPELVIIDTAADTFAGDEIKRAHVRNFINSCLKVIAHELSATVILTSHPSKQGMNEGSGLSGSTAWNNSVRSRLYLTRPSNQSNSNIRVLESKKSNYGPTGNSIRLEWRNGVFHNIDSRVSNKPEDRKLIDEAIYLKALDALINRGQRGLLTKNQASYAPKLMLQMDDVNGLTMQRLEQAQERLLNKLIINSNISPEEKSLRLQASIKIINKDEADKIINQLLF
jgi:RecA-family ATPase